MKPIIITFIIALCSCKKLVEVDLPSDRITRATVFENDATAIAALNGMYTQLIRTGSQTTSGGTTIYTGLSSDELYNSTSSASTDEFTQNSISPANTLLRSNLWTPAYNIIYQANSIIEGSANSTSLTPSIKQQLEGEAKFIRAFVYFYLVNTYGDVPLVLSTDYTVTATQPRAATADVYAQIVTDLETSKSLLSDTYQGAGRARVNKWAAASLLARVYLYQQKWDKAETESSAVINAGLYSLNTNLANVFLMGSNETIWQIMPVSTTFNTPEGNTFIPSGTATPTYPLTNVLVNAFAANDQRKANWIKSVVVTGNTYYYPYKYKVKTATTLTEYYVALRLAELYLIRAEARAQLNKIALALSDLNTIHTRAGLPSLTAPDVATLLSLIEKERQLELFCEWGHRWFDLKRTGRADAILGNKPGWQSTDALYPIPFTEIQRNPALTQNPGY